MSSNSSCDVCDSENSTSSRSINDGPVKIILSESSSVDVFMEGKSENCTNANHELEEREPKWEQNSLLLLVTKCLRYK